MSRVGKKMGFEKKAILILNDVAEIVLKWNLGDISEQQALNKINDVFRKFQKIRKKVIQRNQNETKFHFVLKLDKILWTSQV